VERLIQAEIGSEPGLVRRAHSGKRLLAEHHRDRVTRQHPHHQEDQDRDPDDRGDADQEPPQQVQVHTADYLSSQIVS
jgi:hypothetical protein